MRTPSISNREQSEVLNCDSFKSACCKSAMAFHGVDEDKVALYSCLNCGRWLNSDGSARRNPSHGKKVTVKLPEKDWRDLVNFVRGDLHNMDWECEIRIQMERICKTIMEAK